MSGSYESCMVYISDLGYSIDINSIVGQDEEDQNAHQAEQQRIANERRALQARIRLSAIGDIPLLCEKVISPFDLHVPPEEWMWQVYQAERRLREFDTLDELEDAFARLCCTNLVRDSSFESSVVAGGHEKTHTPHLQNHELARL